MSDSLTLVETFGGVSVINWADPEVRRRACQIDPTLGDFTLRYDEIYPSMHLQAVLVGCQDHFLWVLLQRSLNNDARRAAREHIRATAERILGEPWTLLDEMPQ